MKNKPLKSVGAAFFLINMLLYYVVVTSIALPRLLNGGFGSLAASGALPFLGAFVGSIVLAVSLLREKRGLALLGCVIFIAVDLYYITPFLRVLIYSPQILQYGSPNIMRFMAYVVEVISFTLVAVGLIIPALLRVLGIIAALLQLSNIYFLSYDLLYRDGYINGNQSRILLAGGILILSIVFGRKKAREDSQDPVASYRSRVRSSDRTAVNRASNLPGFEIESRAERIAKMKALRDADIMTDDEFRAICEKINRS